MTAPESTDLLGRLRESANQFLQPVEFRIVSTTEELRAAAALVYREYLKRNYLTPHPSCLKLSIYNALPTTATFIAKHPRRGVIGTITLIEDSPLGLVMDDAYKSELDSLRRGGHRLAEASMLAIDTELFGRGVFTLFHTKKLLLTLHLFKVMFDYLRSSTPMDEVVACFNPKHQVLYEFLQLKPLGGVKAYLGANGNPAVAMHLNVHDTEAHATCHAAYRLFYGQRPRPEPFAQKLFLSPEDLRRLFVEETGLLQSASPTELAYLRDRKRVV